jgi:transcriptional regulator with XRE-family HTH domain
LVARNLRRLRVAKGLSQEGLAADAGIDRTYVSRLERGMENPTVALLERLTEALGSKIVDFFAAPKPGERLRKPCPAAGGRRGAEEIEAQEDVTAAFRRTLRVSSLP